ncbi:hypothetical protein HMPREF1548_03437 [Clostridium sp. KLE 1755]|nr:hypothetical protein HMPREF1548_03437 [Clostridium sp. KLE 1755]
MLLSACTICTFAPVCTHSSAHICKKFSIFQKVSKTGGKTTANFLLYHSR